MSKCTLSNNTSPPRYPSVRMLPPNCNGSSLMMSVLCKRKGRHKMSWLAWNWQQNLKMTYWGILSHCEGSISSVKVFHAFLVNCTFLCHRMVCLPFDTPLHSQDSQCWLVCWVRDNNGNSSQGKKTCEVILTLGVKFRKIMCGVLNCV